MPLEKLLHVPPAVTSLSVKVYPVHTDPVPVIADGVGLTVTTAEVLQPVDVSTNMIVLVPVLIPLTKPVVDPTVAIPVEPDVHVPAPLTSASSVV
jgi:hypothetical protein